MANEQDLTQWVFSAPFEGIVYHLYLDTRGNVTCGVGFLIPNKAALDRYEWDPDVLAAHDDYDRVKAAEPGHVSRYYQPLCKAALTPATVRGHFDAHVAAVTSDPGMRDWGLATLPNAARVALVDMAFNLGVAGLNRYARLKAAVIERRWADAAAECARKGIQPARNRATQDLFLSLVSAG